MDCRTPGLPVHHQLLEFAQTHVHLVRDAIQPSRPLVLLYPRSKHLLISWLQSLPAVTLETKKIKSVIASTFSPCIFHEVIDAMILVFLNVEF